MTLKPLRIVAVGRLKTPFWKAAAEHYVERLVRWRAFTESIIKDGDPSLPIVDRNALEGKGILSALSASDIPVVLDERGKTFTSRQFSVFLERLSENASRRPCFIIGGAFGLDDSVKQAASHLIALGPLTMTHELARVVLVQQRLDLFGLALAALLRQQRAHLVDGRQGRWGGLLCFRAE